MYIFLLAILTLLVAPTTTTAYCSDLSAFGDLHPRTVRLLEGQSLVLSCELDATLVRQLPAEVHSKYITFTFKENPIDEAASGRFHIRRINEQKAQLFKDNVTAEDAGAYKCWVGKHFVCLSTVVVKYAPSAKPVTDFNCRLTSTWDMLTCSFTRRDHHMQYKLIGLADNIRRFYCTENSASANRITCTWSTNSTEQPLPQLYDNVSFELISANRYGKLVQHFHYNISQILQPEAEYLYQRFFTQNLPFSDSMNSKSKAFNFSLIYTTLVLLVILIFAILSSVFTYNLYGRYRQNRKKFTTFHIHKQCDEMTVGENFAQYYRNMTTTLRHFDGNIYENAAIDSQMTELDQSAVESESEDEADSSVVEPERIRICNGYVQRPPEGEEEKEEDQVLETLIQNSVPELEPPPTTNTQNSPYIQWTDSVTTMPIASEDSPENSTGTGNADVHLFSNILYDSFYRKAAL